MRTKIFALTLAILSGVVPAYAGKPIPIDTPPPRPMCGYASSPAHDHATAKHSGHVCGFRALSEIEVSKNAGLGQVEIRGKIGAVVQRDEGAVALLDLKNPRKPKVLGRYADDIPDSFDGDLAFSKDGNWLFYARQTHQMSKDGIHVLDVSNPKEPRLAFYQPQGGAFRIGYLNHGGAEYVVTMDAIEGLVVSRFEPTTGVLVPVYVDALPALKVGGPASAGVFIDPKDPKLGVPLLYATNGTTGLDVYDLSTPEMPAKLGSWEVAGLADVEVSATKKKRTVYAASEYWFGETTPPTLYVLDATKLDKIKDRAMWSEGFDGSEPWRIQGIELTATRLYVALSHVGLVSFDLGGMPRGIYSQPRPINKDSTLKASPYVMDVDSAKGLLYATDASSGRLTILKPR